MCDSGRLQEVADHIGHRIALVTTKNEQDKLWCDECKVPLLIDAGGMYVTRRLEGVGAIGAPPPHYAGQGMDVFAIVDAFGLDYYEGNVIKYLVRWRKRDGLKDLQKARHYLDEVIARAEREHGSV